MYEKIASSGVASVFGALVQNFGGGPLEPLLFQTKNRCAKNTSINKFR